MVRRQFEAYLGKVFGFADLVAGMPEGRTYPLHPWEKVFDAKALSVLKIPFRVFSSIRR